MLTPKSDPAFEDDGSESVAIVVEPGDSESRFGVDVGLRGVTVSPHEEAPSGAINDPGQCKSDAGWLANSGCEDKAIDMSGWSAKLEVGLQETVHLHAATYMKIVTAKEDPGVS